LEVHPNLCPNSLHQCFLHCLHHRVSCFDQQLSACLLLNLHHNQVEQALLGVECHPSKARQVHLELGLELLQVTHLGAIFSVQVQQHLVQGLQPPCNLGLEGLGSDHSLDLGSKPWEVHWEHLVRQDKWGLVCPAHLEVGWELQLVVEVLQVQLLVEVLQELHLLVDLEVLHQVPCHKKSYSYILTKNQLLTFMYCWPET
jgi:hypothetical protein